MGANIKTRKMRNNRHQRQRGEKDRSKWDVMSEAERVVERPVEKKRDRERDFLLFFYGDTAFYLPVLLL